MKKTLWGNKGSPSPDKDCVQEFTVGNDREWDMYLARFDVLGSIAHTKMLGKVGLLKADEVVILVKGLVQIYAEIQEGRFSISSDVEDIHSQVEILLTERLGDVGKKIHMARSRNDQVLLDVKLFLRAEIEELVQSTTSLFDVLVAQAEKHKADLMPGYTHMQLAMPSSFGLWFGSYAESLIDDLGILKATFDVVNKNPLGSAAGYGSSFPIDRELTTVLLGFADLNTNVVYAQMGRGKVERLVASALSNLADTLSRMSMDVCLYLNQNFSFMNLPPELSTGSSIMPHKKNPDVFELIRARCNRLKALPNEMMLITSNLPSGYHRDLQILKEHLFPAFHELKQCFSIAEMMLSKMTVKKDLLKSPEYLPVFSVEEVNRLVLTGIPFRDAYHQVAASIEAGTFAPATDKLNHVHVGSIGNLGLDQVKAKMKLMCSEFRFGTIHQAFEKLSV